MMFGWCEIDLAFGCARYMPPLQGLGVLRGRLPRALPWAIALCPVGAEDRCPFWGRKTGAPLGQKTGALLGPKIGAPLKGIPVRRWGGRPVRRWGGRPVGRGNLFSTPTGFKAKAQGNALG